MANVQPHHPPGFRVNLARTLAAHLAGESVSVKNFGSQFCGDRA
jgi:hypothetical protein